MDVTRYEKNFLADLYRTLLTIRVFETQCIKLYRTGAIIGYFHPYLGEEAVATGVCAALTDGDTFTSTHRGHGHCLAGGADIKRMLAELLGKATGYCGGRGGSMHIADLSTGNLGANGIVGAGIPIGVGAALGASIRGERAVTAVFFSDGASNQGTFAEAMNLAAIWDLPVILVLENNHYAVSTPVEAVSRTKDLCERAKGYGVEAITVDGNQVLDVYDRACLAAQTCRAGRGPVLMECKTYRHQGHHVNDPGQYMPADRLAYYKSIDPVDRGRAFLLSHPDAAIEDAEAIEREVEQAVADAIAFATAAPKPSVEQFLQEVAE